MGIIGELILSAIKDKMIVEEAMEDDSVPSNEGDAVEEDHDDEDVAEETNGWFYNFLVENFFLFNFFYI